MPTEAVWALLSKSGANRVRVVVQENVLDSDTRGGLGGRGMRAGGYAATRTKAVKVSNRTKFEWSGEKKQTWETPQKYT